MISRPCGTWERNSIGIVIHSVFLVVLWLLLFMACATVLGCTIVVRSVRRANRVHPGRRSAAPLRWLYSWREPARLPRRRRRAVTLAQSAVTSFRPPARRWRQGDGGGSLTAMADELA